MVSKSSQMAHTLKRNQEKRASQTGAHVTDSNNKLHDKETIQKFKEKKKSWKNLLNTSPNNLATFSKSVTNDPKKNDIDPVDNLNNILKSNKELFESYHRRVLSTKENSKNILGLFLDMKLGVEMIISLIMSPNKMTDEQLNYFLEDDFLIGEEELRLSLVEHIRLYMDKEYNLTDELPIILEESLANSGACPHMIVSEAEVDEIINTDLLANVSMEDFKASADYIKSKFFEPKRLLGQRDHTKVELEEKEISVENFANYLVNTSMSITDNQSIFLYGNVKNKLRSAFIRKDTRRGGKISTESIEKMNYMDLFRDVSKPKDNVNTVFIKDKKRTKRKSIGKPMNIKVPTSAVVPVFRPSNKDDPDGFFVLMDENGGFLDSALSPNAFNRLNNNLHVGSVVNNPLTDVYRDLVQSRNGNTIDVGSIYEMYKELVDNNIFDAFKSSLYGEHVEIANNEDIYYIMFCRALQGQQTNVLYVPKENMIYYSLENNEYGLGKTLFDDLMVICSVRAILFFAKVMAFTRQAIDITDVNVELDEEDRDPEKTLEQIKTTVLKLRENFLPLGMMDPQMLTEWIQKSGLNFNVERHPRLPNIRINYEKGGMQSNSMPQDDIDEELKRQAIMGMGLRPENIEEAFSANFAATTIFNNALLAKRIGMYQKAFAPEITKHVRAIVYNDENLRSELKDIFRDKEGKIRINLEETEKALLDKSEEEFLEYYLDKLSENIYVELPPVPDSNVDSTDEEFGKYSEKVEKLMDHLFNDDMFDSSVAGETGEKLRTVKSAMTALLLRRWAGDNNYLPEVFKLLGGDSEDAKVDTSSVTHHYDKVLEMVVTLIDNFREPRIEADKILKKNDEIIENSGSDAESDYSSFDDSSSGDEKSEETTKEGGGGFQTFDLEDDSFEDDFKI